jgi:hypothetical protein
MDICIQGRAVNKYIDLSVPGSIAGVYCVDCYAYIGASVAVTLDYYHSGKQVDMEIKLKGRTGVNMALDLNLPSVSGAQTVTAIPPSSSTQPLLYERPGAIVHLKMNTQFMGMTMTVSGTGSSQIQANISKHFSQFISGPAD